MWSIINGRQKTICRGCVMRKINSGRTFTKEQKKNVSDALKLSYKNGNRHQVMTDAIKEKISRTKLGRSISEEHKQKISDGHRKRSGLPLGIKLKRDKKHLCPTYKLWVQAVKNRDGWKCKISDGDCSGRLEVHHILNWVEYPELRYEINNGITLCVNHHPRGRLKEKQLSSYFMKLVTPNV